MKTVKVRVGGKVKSPKIMKAKRAGALKPMKTMKFSTKSAAKRSTKSY